MAGAVLTCEIYQMKAYINLFDRSIALVADRVQDPAERVGYLLVELSAEDLEKLKDGPCRWSFEDPEHPEAGGVERFTPPVPVPASVPAWRIRAVAKVTPAGAGSLHEAIVAAIGALEDPLQQAVAEEIYLGGNVLERGSELLALLAGGLGLEDAEVDALFIQAAKLPT